jgi:hypothetical protein
MRKWAKKCAKIESEKVCKSMVKVSLCTTCYSQKHGRVSYEEERKRKQEVTALICNFVLQQQQQEKSSGSQHIKLKTKKHR